MPSPEACPASRLTSARAIALDRHERSRLRRKIDRDGSHAAHPAGQYYEDDDLRNGHGIGQSGPLPVIGWAVSAAPGVLDGISFADEIMVAQLLHHTSGLHKFNGEKSRDFFNDLFTDSRRGTRLWTAGELLAYARKPEHRPTGRPGEKKSVLEHWLHRARNDP